MCPHLAAWHCEVRVSHRRTHPSIEVLQKLENKTERSVSQFARAPREYANRMCQELRLFIRERSTAMHRSMSGSWMSQALSTAARHW